MTTVVRRVMRKRRSMEPGEADAGIAMVMVMLIMLTVSILIVAMSSMSLASMVQARARQDSPAALQAAEAGIDDFQTRLNQSPTNFVPTATNDPALAGWVSVSGAANGAQYRVWIDNSVAATGGRYTVVSSGRVNKKVRTLRATLRVNSFADYLYFTNYETLAPAAGGAPSCDVYAWASARSSGCNINFKTGDVLDGKVFSNDTISMTGTPTFQDTVETGAATGVWNGGGTPVFNGYPATTSHAAVQALPVGNAQLKTDAQTSFAGQTGCVFYGPTQIRLVPAIGAVSAHMMVTSPNTVSSMNPGPGCGTWPATEPLGGNQTEQSVPMPGNGIAYVANVPPAVAVTYCLNQFESPTTSGLVGDIDMPYSCTDGDAFVHGTNGGQITIGSQSDIYVTNNLLDDGGATTITGLISNNFIWLWHPVDSSNNNLHITTTEDGTPVTSPPVTGVNGLPANSMEVDALMLADTDSIINMNWSRGPVQGTFKVVGGLIQNFRGTVGTSSPTGYTKLYTYDSRLRGLIPPHFSQPGNITWGRDRITEDVARSN